MCVAASNLSKKAAEKHFLQRLYPSGGLKGLQRCWAAGLVFDQAGRSIGIKFTNIFIKERRSQVRAVRPWRLRSPALKRDRRDRPGTWR